MKIFPFDSWDGVNDLSGTVEQARLEQFFGPSAVAFSTYQSAISATLEILGARSHLIPVIMPITAAPDTIAAALRAGAEPFLIDIHPQTLQMDPEALTTVLDELGGAVVLLTRPGGQPVDPELLARAGENPTILDSRMPPHKAIEPDCVCTFSVFDLGPIVGTGSVVIHKFKDQVRELKIARNGLLGLGANLNDLLAAGAYKRLQTDLELTQRRLNQQASALRYLELLQAFPIPFKESPEWPYFVVSVPNAERVVAHLYAHGFSAMQLVCPLHLIDEIGKRWIEKPSYPVAESLHNKLVALPTNLGILGRESTIVDRLVEVCDAIDTVGEASP